MKILLAEQYRSIATSLQILFTEYGIEADAANDGVQALERLENKSYDLLIAETQLPRIDGATLVNLAKQRGVSIKAIGILPQSEINEKDLSDGYGMDALIPKPFSAQKLIALVEALIDEKPVDYENLLFQQRKLMAGLKKESVLSGDRIKEFVPDDAGSVLAFVRATNVRLSKIGEKQKIVYSENGYKVVSV